MTDRRTRWRLILGKKAQAFMCESGDCQADPVEGDREGSSSGPVESPAIRQGGDLDRENAQRDEALSYLYDRDEANSENVLGAGLGPSRLTVPEWINSVHELFPREGIERLERDAMERYKISEIVTNPAVLRRLEANTALLQAILQSKNLMQPRVLAMAREIVRKVIQQLLDKLTREVRQPFLGARLRQRTMLRSAKNFDARTTIRRNLRFYDSKHKRIGIQTPYFLSRIKRHAQKWQIIILVDQSGSMAQSVIHSAVCAAIFAGIPSLRMHLVAFDTSVVDLSESCADPVEVLMKVQLGGGTNIHNALHYGASLIDAPRRAILVLITDFEEGGDPNLVLGVAKKVIESGAILLGLAALDEEGTRSKSYNGSVAQKFADLGAHVAAMTPSELAIWVAEKVR